MLNYFNHQLQSEITPLHSYNQVWSQKMCDFRNGSITACVFGFLGWNISETGSSGLSSEECFPVKNCEFWIRDIFWIQAWSAKGNSRNGNNHWKAQSGLFLNPSAQKWTGINDEKHLGAAGAERAGCGADMNKQWKHCWRNIPGLVL